MKTADYDTGFLYKVTLIILTVLGFYVGWMVGYQHGFEDAKEAIAHRIEDNRLSVQHRLTAIAAEVRRVKE